MRLTVLAVSIVLIVGVNAWAWMCGSNPDHIFCDNFDRYCVDPPLDGSRCPAGSPKNVAPLHQVWHNEAMNYREDKACGALMNVEDDTTQLYSPPFGGRICNDGITALGELGQANVNLLPGIQAKFGAYDQVQGGEGTAALRLTFRMSGGIRGAAALWGSLGYLELALEQTPYNRQQYHDIEVTPTDYILIGADEGAGCSSCQGHCQQQFGVPGIAMRAMMPTICQSYSARTASSLCPDPANPTGPRIPCGPPYCPPVSETDIHHTIAIGVLSFLDPNPCHCEMPNYIDPSDPRIAHNHVPTNYHLAFFDGWKWRILNSEIFDDGQGHGIPGVTGSGQFLLGARVDLVDFYVKPTTVDIHHMSDRLWVYNDPMHPEYGGTYVQADVHSYAYNIPRKYLGGFNVMRSGTAPGCAMCSDPTVDGCAPAQWDGVSPKCIQWAGTQCIRVGGKLYYGAPDACDGNAVLMTSESHVSLDDVILSGGAPDLSTGACCSPGSCTVTTLDGCTNGTFAGAGTDCNGTACNGACCGPQASCTVTDALACTGRFRGAGTNCSSPCCPSPFADFDGDHDVDMDDFAVLQRCVSTGSTTIAAECACFDHNHDDAINSEDVLLFTNCATGPLLVPETVPPECAP